MFAIELMQAASKYSNTIKLVSGCTSSNPPECIGDGHYVSSFSSAIAGGTTVVSFMAGQGYEVTLSQPLEDMIPAGTMIYFSPAPFSGDGTWMFGVPSDARSQQAWPRAQLFTLVPLILPVARVAPDTSMQAFSFSFSYSYDAYDVFDKFDADGSGALNVNELQALLNAGRGSGEPEFSTGFASCVLNFLDTEGRCERATRGMDACLSASTVGVSPPLAAAVAPLWLVRLLVSAQRRLAS